MHTLSKGNLRDTSMPGRTVDQALLGMVPEHRSPLTCLWLGEGSSMAGQGEGACSRLHLLPQKTPVPPPTNSSF